MSARKRKDEPPRKDPWDAPVKGTRDKGDADNETVRIPIEVIEELAAEEAPREELLVESRPLEDLMPAPEPDPRDDRILALEVQVAELTVRLEEATLLQEQTRAAYRKREKELTSARERLERDREKHLDRSRIALLERLFEPMDNLERSVSSAKSWPNKDERTDGLLGGLEMVRRQLNDRMAEFGLSRFDPVGETFDPNIHEALSAIPVTDPRQDGRVIEVWEPGYRCGDTVIRAAKVVVGRKT